MTEPTIPATVGIVAGHGDAGDVVGRLQEGPGVGAGPVQRAYLAVVQGAHVAKAVGDAGEGHEQGVFAVLVAHGEDLAARDGRSSQP